jgi:hypothetical protein
MKIQIKLSLLILALFVQFSCTDWLERKPQEGLIREEFWKTKEDVESVIMGAYAEFRGIHGNLFKFGELRGDMLKGDINQGGNELQIMESTIYPENGLCNWQNFYKVINYCNEIIYYIPEVQANDNTFTDYIRDGFLSEAYFLRSLSYFYLVRIFKEVPLVLEPTLTDATFVYPEKSTEDQVLDKIMADLLQARNWATIDGYPSMVEIKGRATKGAIDALIADIALWRFDYETCISHVDNIIMSRAYSLMPQNRWFELYYPGNTLEGIFEFQFNQALGQSNDLVGLTQLLSHNYRPSDYAVEIFSKVTNSEEAVRGEDASIAKVGLDDYIIWKFIGAQPDGQTERFGTIRNSCNWIVYRYADVLLMKAEALSQLGRYNEAYDIVNAIRIQRGISSTPVPASSPIAYEDFILDERCKELAFEGKRWFDLMRMGRRNDYSRKRVLIDIMVRNVPSTQKRIIQTKLTNPWSWYLPVYKSELERNKNMVQNPYYNF